MGRIDSRGHFRAFGQMFCDWVGRPRVFWGVAILLALGNGIPVFLNTSHGLFPDEWWIFVRLAGGGPTPVASGEWSWAWLFEPHSGHIIVFSKTLYALVGALSPGGANFPVIQILSHFIFLTGLFLTLWFLRRMSGGQRVPGWLWLWLFWLSPSLYENHISGFQSCHHFGLWFGLVAFGLLAIPRLSAAMIISSVLLAAAAALSVGQGIFWALGVGTLMLVRAVLPIEGSETSTAQPVRRWSLLVGAAAVFASAVFVALLGRGVLVSGATTGGIESVVSPSAHTVHYFFDLLAWYFFYATEGAVSFAIGVLALLSFFVFLWDVWMQGWTLRRWSAFRLALAVCAGQVLVSAAVIALQRSYLTTAKVSRYLEHGLPFAFAVITGLWMSKRAPLRYLAGFLFLVLAVGSLDDWNHWVYGRLNRDRIEGRRCAIEALDSQSTGPIECLYTVPQGVDLRPFIQAIGEERFRQMLRAEAKKSPQSSANPVQ